VAAATRVRSKTKKTHVRSSLSSSRLPEPDSPEASPLLTQASRDLEPLETAERNLEGPEASQTRGAEAPDAGRGVDSSSLEGFPLGRSRS
jgi:hypothetical protein